MHIRFESEGSDESLVKVMNDAIGPGVLGLSP